VPTTKTISACSSQAGNSDTALEDFRDISQKWEVFQNIFQDLWHFYNTSHTKERAINIPTPLQRIAAMNEAFGNPAGDFDNIDPRALLNQCRNIFDEYVELLHAFGVSPDVLHSFKVIHNNTLYGFEPTVDKMDVTEVRDALCDIQVFAGGAQHLMGVDADVDMHSVINGVMSRFIKDEEDKQATIALHAAKGVTDVYFEGEFPRMVMKSASDQPDAPRGKFLKSASYMPTRFYAPLDVRYAKALGANDGQAMAYAGTAEIARASGNSVDAVFSGGSMSLKVIVPTVPVTVCGTGIVGAADC